VFERGLSSTFSHFAISIKDCVSRASDELSASPLAQSFSPKLARAEADRRAPPKTARSARPERSNSSPRPLSLSDGQVEGIGNTGPVQDLEEMAGEEFPLHPAARFRLGSKPGPAAKVAD